jgi:hypothetical protein
MSEQELYEIARARIDRRNRRWTLWAIDLAGLVLSLAVVILLSSTPYVEVAAAVMMGWGGIFTLHTIMAGMAQSRESDIEGEVEKLRAVVYEKPKRLELSEDGELLDTDDWLYEDAPQKQKL